MINLSNPIYDGTFEELVNSKYGAGKYMTLRGYIVEALYGTKEDPGTQLVLTPTFNAPDSAVEEVHIHGTPGVYRVLKMFAMYDGKLESISDIKD